MEINVFLVLGFTLFIFAVTPGPGTLALLSISTSRGLASAIFFSLGMTLGDLSYLTIVIFSLNVFNKKMCFINGGGVLIPKLQELRQMSSLADEIIKNKKQAQ